MDKGSALIALVATGKPAMVAYAGDDLGDIAALRAVREAGGCALVVDHGRETPLLLLELAGQTYAGPDEFAGWLAWRRRLAPDGTGDQALLRVGLGPLARLVGRHHRAGPVRAHSRAADLAVAGEVPAAGNVGTFAFAGRGPAVRSVVVWISP